MRAAQDDVYGADGARLHKKDMVRNEDGIWCRVLGEGDVHVVVLPTLRTRVFRAAHGSGPAGHWGVFRMAAKVR
jgi:hypothetical protein